MYVCICYECMHVSMVFNRCSSRGHWREMAQKEMAQKEMAQKEMAQKERARKERARKEMHCMYV